MIKICGITNEEDLMAVASLNPDAVGFVLARSPRQINTKTLLKLVAKVPPGLSTFGVFVNPNANMVDEAISRAGIDIVQLHGEESPEFCKRFAPRVVKVFRFKAGDDIGVLKDYESVVRGFLVDAWVEDQYGGTGKQVDVRLAKKIMNYTGKPVILAGGLTPRNLQCIVERVRPFGVDVSSGIETHPGKKDVGLCRDFIMIARELGL